MTLADLFAAVLALALAGVGFNAFARLAPIVAPALVARSSARLARRPAGTLLLGAGVLVTGFLSIVTLLQVPFPLARLSALGLLFTTLTLAAIGAVGVTTELGTRLGGGFREGALVLGLSSLLPIVGWFVVFPAAFCLALGAGLLAPFSRSNVPAQILGAAA